MSDPLAPVVARGWRRWLERLCLRGLRLSRRTDLHGEALVAAVGALAPGAPIEAWRDEGQVVVLVAKRFLRIRI